MAQCEMATVVVLVRASLRCVAVTMGSWGTGVGAWCGGIDPSPDLLYWISGCMLPLRGFHEGLKDFRLLVLKIRRTKGLW